MRESPPTPDCGPDAFGARLGRDTSGLGRLVRRVEAQPLTPRACQELGP